MQSFFNTPDKKKRHQLLIGDLAGITLNLYLTAVVSMHLEGSLGQFFSILANLSPFARAMAIADLLIFFTAIFLLFGSVHIGVYHLTGLYRISAFPNVRKTATRLGAAVFFSILIVFTILAGTSRTSFSLKVWVFHAGSLFMILLFWRFFYFSKHSTRSPYRICIVGGDTLSGQARGILSANGNGPLFRFSVIPEEIFFSGGEVNPDMDMGRCNMIVYPFAGTFSNERLVSLVRKKFEGVSICDSLTFYKNSTGSFPVHALDARWLINLSVSLSLMDRFQQRVKRLFDVGAAAIAILVSLPAVALIAALIRCTSRGPVFYVHERLGLHRKPFRFIKFRTMVADAEKDTGPVWAQKNDPRVTPVGRFLRKTRLDELPQLINILKGEMSIVGPRPIRKYFADRLSEEFPYYFLRFYVKPGLTGWAQVLGGYGETKEEQLKKLEYDLFYIHEYSLRLDAAIIFRTVLKVINGAGQ